MDVKDSVESQIDNLIEASMQSLNTENTNEENTNEENTNEEENSETTTNETSTNETPNIATNIEGFNTALHQYLELEEEIKVLLNAIKLRNQKKKQLGLSLSTYLRENQIKNVNLGGTYKGKKLESVVTHKATGFNKVSVTDAIYNELKNDDEVFGKIMEAISKKSVMSEIWKIKITSDKVSKQNKEKNNIAMAEELLNDE
jgi:hypothetical protein